VTLCVVPVKSEIKMPMHELENWLTDKWIPQNQIMTFKLGPKSQLLTHDHPYEDSFSGPPTMIMRASKICFMFEVIDMRSIWRNWIILRFITDLEQDFPDLKISDFKVKEIT